MGKPRRWRTYDGIWVEGATPVYFVSISDGELISRKASQIQYSRSTWSSTKEAAYENLKERIDAVTEAHP